MKEMVWFRQLLADGGICATRTDIHYVQQSSIHSTCKDSHTSFSHQIYQCITLLHQREIRQSRDMLEILSNGGCDMDVMIRTQSRIQNYQLCLGYLFSLGHTSDTTCCAWHQPTNPHQNCNAHSFSDFAYQQANNEVKNRRCCTQNKRLWTLHLRIDQANFVQQNDMCKIMQNNGGVTSICELQLALLWILKFC